MSVSVQSALAVCLLTVLGVASSDVHNARGIAEFLRGLDVCIVESGTASAPLNVSLPLNLSLQITELCCSGTEVANLSASSSPAPTDDPDWQGGTNITFALGQLATNCYGKWKASGNRSGGLRVNISRNQELSDPFLQLGIVVDGAKIVTQTSAYPFPSSVTSEVECTLNINIKGLHFDGYGASILNGISPLLLSKTIQDELMAKIKHRLCKSSIPDAINRSLAKARILSEPLLQSVPEDLVAPVAPPGAEPSTDMRRSAMVGWLHSFMQQGFVTGQVAELIRRLSDGNRSMSREFRGAGLQLAEMVMDFPVSAKLGVSLQGASAGGLSTLGEVGFDVLSAESLALSLKEAQLDLSVDLRVACDAATAGQAGEGVSALRQLQALQPWDQEGARLTAAAAMQALASHLLERFYMNLSLANLSANARAGLLVEHAEAMKLSEGQSWYDTACLRSLVQNASITGLDVGVTVPRFVWGSHDKSSEDMEVELDAAVNSLLSYLNSPQMRRTVSQLIRSVAAGPVRDAFDLQLQGLLSNTDGSMCAPKNGFASMPLFSLLTVAGSLAALGGFAALSWRAGSSDCERQGRKSAGLAVVLLAFASGCYQLGGLLGRPLRAGFRLRSGDHGDPSHTEIFMNAYVVDILDLFGHVDGMVALTAAACALSAARIVSVSLAATSGFSVKASRRASLLGAVAGWGLLLILTIASTQVIAFHIPILAFGDMTWDLGALVGLCVYFQALGLYLLDTATVIVSEWAARADCSEEAPGSCWMVRRSAEAPEEGLANRRSLAPSLDAAQEPAFGVRMMAALVGLLGGLAALLISPFLRLWTEEWGGVLGHVLTYQSRTLQHEVSLASIVANEGFLLNSGPLEVGARLLQLFLLFHVLIAPVAHAVLAIALGFQAQGRAAHSVECAAEAERTLQPSKGLARAFQLARMWSAADAFAVVVLVVGPELHSELEMMRQQSCSDLAPVLPALGESCFELDVHLGPGAPVLLAAGLTVRILAEYCARGCARVVAAPVAPTGADHDMAASMEPVGDDRLGADARARAS